MLQISRKLKISYKFSSTKSALRLVSPLDFRIDGTSRLLIIPFFATLPNLIQHSLFIYFGEICQPPLLFETSRLLIHVHSRQR